MKRLLLTALVLVSLGLASGCQTTHHVRLDDGAGLVEGSPVLVSGVRVGVVQDVRIIEGQVDVEIAIERDHEVTIREDTCALPAGGASGPALALSVGTGAPLSEARPIPQCRIDAPDVGDLFRTLGDGFGQILRQLGGGMRGAGPAPATGSSGGTTAPTPPPDPNAPAPPPPGISP